MPWPTASDLASALTAASITLPSWTTAAGILASAIDDFEQATGISPWETDGVPSDSEYTPNGTPVLLLRSPYQDITAVEVDGSALAAESYSLKPDGAVPKWWIEFFWDMTGDHQSITVTGTRGYGAVPADAYAAVMARCLEVAKEYQQVASGGGMSIDITNATRIKQGSVEIEMQGKASSSASSLGFSDAIIKKYRRVTL